MFGYLIFNFVANRSADATMKKKKKKPTKLWKNLTLTIEE